MPRVCTICTSPARRTIDKELVAGHLVNRRIAAQHSLAETSVRRHAASHLPASLVAAAEAEDLRQALDVLGQLKAINAASLSVLADARRAGDGDLALKAVDRVQRQIELQAKLLGELDERPVVNLVASPEWLQVRAVILDVLADAPDRRLALVSRLQALERPA